MLVFSPVMERLIRMFTWRGALRISGIFVLCLGLPFALLCKSPEETAKEVERVDRKYSKCAEALEDSVGKYKRDLQKVYPGDDTDDRRVWKTNSSEEDCDDNGNEGEGCSLRGGSKTHGTNSNCIGDKEHAIDLLENAVVQEEEEKLGCQKWLFILGSWRSWFFFVSVFISTFAWSFYWVNLVSCCFRQFSLAIM